MSETFTVLYRDDDGVEREKEVNARAGETFADAVVREASMIQDDADYLIGIKRGDEPVL